MSIANRETRTGNDYFKEENKDKLNRFYTKSRFIRICFLYYNSLKANKLLNLCLTLGLALTCK